MSPARFTLTTPSLGVQQWRDDDSKGTTRVAWASTGGRGLARRLILLPVVEVVRPDGERRWAPPPELLEELKRNPRAFWRQFDEPLRKLRRDLVDKSVRVGVDDGEKPGDPAEPRSTEVADDFGAQWDANHLVVLLVYDDSPDIGEPGDGVGERAGREVEAIKRFFGEAYSRRLVTRGLVRLPRVPPNDLVFAVASCQYPADMTDGAPNDHLGLQAPANASLLRLSRLLTPATDESPSLLLMVGDQVYVDATAGLFDPRSQNDRLRLPYQNLMASPGAQSVFGLLPVAMILDDHELSDNWEPGTPATPEFINEGKSEYRRFQRMAGPPLRDDEALSLWCEFTYKGVPFFLADTRTERETPNCAPRRVDNWRQARIMSEAQWSALETFLRTYQDRVSFVVSPAMLLPRALRLGDEPSLAVACDSWDGFPASMHDLLALLCDKKLGRVVFLSGDVHRSCLVRATVTNGKHQTTFWSVHSSGLYCPYPFANDIEENYACKEEFRFELPDADGGTARKYACKIECVDWAEGDGFATLTLTNSGSQTLRVCFNRAKGDVPSPEIRIPAS